MNVPLEQVEGKVREIIADQLGLSEEDISLQSSFIDDLGADHLDFMEIVMAFEEEFELDIDDEIAENLSSVQDAIDLISKRNN
ncbi:MAG TPA: acyl carrier protein [bacterium]|nr:acyl carrier protein [bacterium]HQG13101.1 acyl carrier protein [bacterium]HQH81114.1 acyl carrier protein [bacterium]